MISQTRFELMPLLHGKKIGVELPNYCGIEDVGYIWHNTWSPAELEYKGNLINESYIEDDLLTAYREDTGEDDYEVDKDFIRDVVVYRFGIDLEE